MSQMREIYEALRRHAASERGKPIFSDAANKLSRSELLGRASALYRRLRFGANRIGVLCPNGVDWAVAQFMGVVAGKTIVPLPPFFSQEQLGHIVRDACVELILCDDDLRSQAVAAGVATEAIACHNEVEPIEFVGGFKQIIYTSGSTSLPKGVRLGERQIAWSTKTLAEVSEAHDRDFYLSIMPLSLLLETISAVFLPLLVGGRTHFPPESANVFNASSPPDLVQLFESVQPTSCVLSPQLLGMWVQQLAASGRRAPETLRFVAVGGAATPPALIEAARASAIPVYEGYGLSECCAVVALNRPGAHKTGTVGCPLPGLEVQIEEGEIVVTGPSVMEGYLGEADAGPSWRTGDLGAFDAEGYLTILGRKDNLLVTSFGRNVSPEWIEAMLLVDRRIGLCMVFGHGAPHLTALITPSTAGREWFADAGREDALALISRLCAPAPDYAVPRDVIVMSVSQLVALGLLTSNGRFRRNAVAKHFVERSVESLS
jgi:long-subunit acyl-CoA synthetase (AMP-forming)